MQEEMNIQTLEKKHKELIDNKILYMFESINAIECLLFMHQIDYLEIAYSLVTEVDLEEFSPIFKSFNSEKFQKGTYYIDMNEKTDVLKRILKATYFCCESTCVRDITEENKPLLKVAMTNINEILAKLNENDKELKAKLLAKRAV